jgi:hypothetical protein
MTLFYKTAVCSTLSANAEEEWCYILFVHEAEVDK